MILTGRTGVFALVCVLPIAVAPWPATTFALLLAVLVMAVVVDAGLAASPRALRFSRAHNGSVRLGEPVNADLLIHNDGRRRFRGPVRDAWAPSMRPQPRTHRVDIAAGEMRRVETCLRPVRRGDQRSAAVTARSIGPLGMAGRQRSMPVPGQIGVVRRSLSRILLPARLAMYRVIDVILPSLRGGHGT